MSKPRFPEEFKIEAVKQVTERGYPVAEVASRLGVSAHSLYQWLKRYDPRRIQPAEPADQQAEIRRLKAELKRVTEERDILKKPPHTLPRSPGKVCLHPGPCAAVPYSTSVSCYVGTPQRLLRLESIPAFTSSSP